MEFDENVERRGKREVMYGCVFIFTLIKGYFPLKAKYCETHFSKT